jgi:predicted ATP-grasp superfamily ATP-dependent carboligase
MVVLWLALCGVPKMRILVLDGTHKAALAITRTLGKEHEIHVVAPHKRAIAFYSKYCKKRIILPRHNIQPTLEHIKKVKYDLVIPVGWKSFEQCSKVQEEIKTYSNIIITSHENIKIALDKRLTHALATRLKIPVPEIFPEPYKFPVVIKSAKEDGRGNVEYAWTTQEFDEKYQKVWDNSDRQPLVQEYVEGDAVGFFAYYNEGKLEHSFMHKRVRQYPRSGGPSTCAEAYWNMRLAVYGAQVLNNLKWNGVAMVEFKGNKLLEINPKFWGSLDLAIASGANFPQIMVSKLTKKPYYFYLADVRFQWISEELKRPSFGMIRDFFRSKNDIRLSDIKPNLFQAARLIIKDINRDFLYTALLIVGFWIFTSMLLC